MTTRQQDTKVARIGERGRLTLPAGIRERYGLNEGDLVAITETERGILIEPRVLVAKRLMDELGEALKGETLESWMASGAEIRKDLVKEMYGIRDTEE
jgi:AbrB family looped-hinge helix DNA binding protein